MNTFQTATKIGFVLIAIGVFCHFLWWYPRLPAEVPSHFDGNGNPDQTMKKNSYFLLMSLLQATFLIGFPILIWFSKKIPNSLYNLPNKEYWLTPERRDETLDDMNLFLLRTGIITMLLMAAMFHLSCEVAIKVRDDISPEFIWIMMVYLVVLFIMLGMMLYKYRLPADAKAT